MRAAKLVVMSASPEIERADPGAVERVIPEQEERRPERHGENSNCYAARGNHHQVKGGHDALPGERGGGVAA